MQEPETKKSRAADSHTAQVYGRNKSQNPLFQGFFENADGVLGADIAGTVAERIVIYVRNLCSGACYSYRKHVTTIYGRLRLVWPASVRHWLRTYSIKNGQYRARCGEMEKLKMSHEILKSGNSSGAFNSRVLGHTYNEVFGYPAKLQPSEYGCFSLAEDMINAGKIYSVQRFKHKWGDVICKGHAFPYGGTWVCNHCGQKDLQMPWWTIKCYKDGNAWCCVGPDFEDLQSSSDYAFGDTRQDALKNYEALMLRPTPHPTSGGGE